VVFVPLACSPAELVCLEEIEGIVTTAGCRLLSAALLGDETLSNADSGTALRWLNITSWNSQHSRPSQVSFR
jgi:hypothetical protein